MLIDTKVTKFPITKAWEKGQLSVKEGRMDDARDYFDMGIAMVAAHSMELNEFSDESSCSRGEGKGCGSSTNGSNDIGKSEKYITKILTLCAHSVFFLYT